MQKALRSVFVGGCLSGILALTAAPPPANAITVPVHGTVFVDLDGDGVQDGGDSGLAGVVVSDGVSVVTTNSAGDYDLVADTGLTRHTFLSLPSGYRATTSFYHRIHLTASPDTADFGVMPDASLSGGEFVFAQITDSELEVAADGPNLRTDMDEVAAAFPAPAFVVMTGDLVDRGDQRDLFQWYQQALAGYPLPVHNVYGNHDAVSSGPPSAAYEDSLGPTYYSFNHNGCHFVVLNDIDWPASQDPWLSLDAAARPPGSRLIVLEHAPPVRAQLDRLQSLGVTVALEGHWHGNRVRRYLGILDINSPNISWPGIDHSPRGFQLVHVTPDSVWCEYRWGGFHQYTRLVSPANASDQSATVIPIRVNAYDSATPVAEVSIQLNGPTGGSQTIGLQRDSPWSYGGTWDASSAVIGTYTGTVTVVDTLGASWQTGFYFRLRSTGRPAVATAHDWPMAQGDAARSGRATDIVSPPLAVAWAAPAGGEPGMAAPVVKNGVVYQGTGRTRDFAECGVTAIDAGTGQRLWRRVLPNAVRNSVTVTDQSVFAITETGHLYALSRASGAVQWMRTLGDTASRWEQSSPSVADGMVFAGRATRLTAFDLVTGLQRWFITPDFDFVPWDYPKGVVAGSRIILSSSHDLYGVNRTTGFIDWSLSGYWRDGAVRNDTLFVAGGDFQHQNLSARRTDTGAAIWTANTDLHTTLSAPALGDSIVVIGTGLGEVEAFSTRNGAQRWSVATGNGVTSTRPYVRTSGDIVASPVVSGSTVYAASTNGRLYGLDLATGQQTWVFDAGVPLRAAPAVSGNTVFLAADDGVVYALVSGTQRTEVGGGTPEPPGSAAPGGMLSFASPLRPGDAVRFAAPAAGRGELLLVDARGRLVRRLYDGPVGPEPREIRWDGRDTAGARATPGIYVIVLRMPEREIRSKALFLRR